MKYLIVSIIVMAVVTYIIRALPLTFFKREITNTYIKSFLAYMPYAVLGAMTVPAIFYCTSSVVSAICGFIAAIILAIFNRGLLTTAAGAVIAVYIVEYFI